MQLEQEAQLVVGGLLDRADLGAAGVVDEHVDAPEALDRSCDRRLAVVRVGDVEPRHQRAVVAGEVVEAVRAS